MTYVPQLDEIEEMLGSGLPDRANLVTRLRAAMEPTLALEGDWDDTSPGPTGNSRLGGLPDLPAEAPWPTHGDQPLSFLLQVDLADVPHPGVGDVLPREGLLSFFFDLDGSRALRVLHTTTGPVPRGLPPGALASFGTHRLSVVEDRRLPGFRHPRFPLSEGDLPDLWDFVTELELDQPGLHLLGVAVSGRSGDPLTQIADKHGEPVSDWVLLAEIGSSHEVFYIGVSGFGGLFVGIRRTDLSGGRFDRVDYVVAG